MLRIALSLFLVAHGIAHLPGFLVPWRLTAFAEMPYSTRVLDGSADLGPVGIRLVGILWGLVALAFIAAGLAIFFHDTAWRTLAVTASLSSLALTVLGWPQSRIGFVVNLLVLAYLFLGARLDLRPGIF